MCIIYEKGSHFELLYSIWDLDISPGHIPPDISPTRTIPSPLHGVGHFLPYDHHHVRIYVKRSTINMYKKLVVVRVRNAC